MIDRIGPIIIATLLLLARPGMAEAARAGIPVSVPMPGASTGGNIVWVVMIGIVVFAGVWMLSRKLTVAASGASAKAVQSSSGEDVPDAAWSRLEKVIEAAAERHGSTSASTSAAAHGAQSAGPAMRRPVVASRAASFGRRG